MVSDTPLLHPQRLFASCPVQRAIATELYESVRDLPIVSPHGHTDPRWFADNRPFANASELLIQPDHYLLRMLVLGVVVEAVDEHIARIEHLDGRRT